MTQVQFRIFVPGKGTEDLYIVDHITEEKDNNGRSLEEPEKVLDVVVDGHLCSTFFAALNEPQTTRLFLNFLRRVWNGERFLINVHLRMPKKQLLDRRGNEMFEKSALERRELDHALAWFSTLGGAFSALGDSMTDCAIIAGKISTQQFKLALRLGDPNLQARCRLYLALSQIQQKHFAVAKRIVKTEYAFAASQLVRDVKLISMCLGIWAKLKYDKGQYRKQQKFNRTATLTTNNRL